MTQEQRQLQFEEWFTTYRIQLKAYARRFVGNRAEDVVQVAFANAWETCVKGNIEINHPKTWLYRLVHNAAINMQKKAFVKHECLALSPDTPDRRSLEQNYIDREELKGALTNISYLPVRQKEVFVERVINEKPIKDAAEELGLTEGAVKQALWRARNELRQGGFVKAA